MNYRQKIGVTVCVLIELGLCAALAYKLIQGQPLWRGWWLVLLIYIFYLIGREIVCPSSIPQEMIDRFGPKIDAAFSEKGQRSARKKFINALRPFCNDKYKKSIKRLEKMIPKCKKPADFAGVYNFIAVNYDVMCDYHTAISYYRKALQHVPDVPRIHSNLCTCLSDLGMHKEAMESMQTAIRYLESDTSHEIGEHDSTYYSNMATLLLMFSRSADALPYAERAFQLDSTNKYAIQALTVANFYLNNFEESDRYRELGLAQGIAPNFLDPSAIIQIA